MRGALNTGQVGEDIFFKGNMLKRFLLGGAVNFRFLQYMMPFAYYFPQSIMKNIVVEKVSC